MRGTTSIRLRMRTRRNEFEIIKDILMEAREASAKTRILHRVNLNVKSFSDYYLKLLLDRDLIESFLSPNGSNLFRTTEKGKDLIEKLREAQETIRGKGEGDQLKNGSE